MASGTVDTTLSLGSSTFLSPTGSLSEVVKPLAPSITSTPLGKAGHREGQTISSDSRLSSASLFASSSYNIPGLPSVGFGSLTPLAPSIAGSHHISSTWSPTHFPPANQLYLALRLSVRHLVLDWPRTSRHSQGWRPYTVTPSKGWRMRC